MSKPAVGPPRRRLTREAVIAAAIDLADRESLDAVTMRSLAADLAVHPTSLYTHLPSKEAILDGMIEALMAEAGLPEEYSDWRDWVRALAHGVRDLARNHPGSFVVLTRRPASGPASLRQAEAALDALDRAGFTPLHAGLVLSGVSLALLGLALNECPPVGPMPEDGLALASPVEYPHIARLLATGDPPVDAIWDLIVDSVVIGIAQFAGAERDDQ